MGLTHLERRICIGRTNIIAIYPSRELPHRLRWKLTNLAKVAREPKGMGVNAKIVIIGSEAEGREWDELDRERIADANLAGRLSILATGALLSKCRLALCNDGGLMHVAGAVGCPLIALMPDTSLSFRPAGAKAVVFTTPSSSLTSSNSHLIHEVLRSDLSINGVLGACLDMLKV